MSSETPASQALLHDDRLLEPARAVLGGHVIATPAGVISFQLVPGSHQPPVRGYLAKHFVAEPSGPTSAAYPTRTLAERVPVATVQLLPGQPLFLDLGVWHANLAWTDRFQWTATYLATPRGEQTLEDTVRYLGWFFDYPHDYPREMFPYLPPSWEASESDSPLFEAMQRCGLLERYLQRYGPGR